MMKSLLHMYVGTECGMYDEGDRKRAGEGGERVMERREKGSKGGMKERESEGEGERERGRQMAW